MSATATSGTFLAIILSRRGVRANDEQAEAWGRDLYLIASQIVMDNEFSLATQRSFPRLPAFDLETIQDWSEKFIDWLTALPGAELDRLINAEVIWPEGER